MKQTTGWGARQEPPAGGWAAALGWQLLLPLHPCPGLVPAKRLARVLQLLAWPLCSQIYQVSPNQPSVSAGGECSEGCSFCGDAASQALLMMSPPQHG